ncbi:phage tail spike protein [Bacillus sp. TL12]|uniref:phage tail spike protein n=1 Tax=Bacillus sp. TL12 TaxID=2894756 RepID=UPI001F519981|nr:phage tail spike protein [Bacillus sp. TL12]MCI0767421.1 phage tail protein [Bacillus sp. TL12]
MSRNSNLLFIVDFKTEQIIGVIKEQDYWNDIRKWELKNNVDILEFTTMDGTKIAASLMQQNLIVKRVRDGSFVSYVITEAEQDSVNRSKRVIALGEHTKLKKSNYIKPQTLQAYTLNQALDFALNGTKWKRGIAEYTSFRTIHIKEFTNPLDLLKQIASTFELEIRFRTEIQGSYIVGRYVDMVKKVGRDNGKEVVLSKDLQGIRRIENSQNVVTALVGVGPSKENEQTGETEWLTFESVNNGKIYTADYDALQRWSKDGTHMFDIYTPETEDQDMTAERLLQLTKMELKKRISTSVLYEVDAIALEKVFGLSHEAVHKGDIVRIKDTKFSPPLFLESRLIAADECDTDPTKDVYYFGEFRELEDMRSRLDKMYDRIMAMFAGKASRELLDALDKALKETNETVDVVKKESASAKDIAEQVLENLDNYQTTIKDGNNPPTTDLEPGKTLWRNTSETPSMLYIWTGEGWDKIGVNTPEEIGAVTTTELNALSEEVRAKVSITEVSDYLDKIGTINDIRNSEWLKDAKYWVVNEEAWSLDTNKKFENANTMRFYAVGQIVKNSSIYSEYVSCQPSEQFVASVYTFANDIASIDDKASLEIEFWNATQLLSQVTKEIKPDKNNDWQRYSVTETAPTGCAKVRIRILVAKNGLMWVAKPQLQRGSVPSVHLPNPNDTINRDELIDKIAEKVALEDYDTKIESIDRAIELNKQGIELSAKKTEVYSKEEANGEFAKDAYVKEMEGRIEITETEISNTVKKGNVISEINQTAETIKIKAELIDLVGKVKAEWIVGQLLSGLQIKTSNTNNYVSLDDQFMRLYESGVVRLYVGYHRRTDGSVQPTLILGGDNTVNTILGTLQMTQMGAGWPSASANIGIVDEVINGVTYKSVFWEMQRNGISVLHANDMQVYYSGIGEWYFRRGKTGLYNTSLVVKDWGGNSDVELRLPTVKLRNSRVEGYRDVVQVLTDSVGDGWGGVKAHIISPSLREYKSNIRDVPFSALEKIRNAKVRAFNYKGDVNLLYEMRENKDPNDPPLTTKDIKTYFGFVVDECDDVFIDKDGTGTHLYSTSALTVKSVQELEEKHDQEIAKLNERLEAKEAEITVLKEKLEAKDIEISTMNSRMASLEALVQNLINNANSTETPTTGNPTETGQQ